MSFSVCSDSGNIPYHSEELVQAFSAGELADVFIPCETCRSQGRNFLRSSETKESGSIRDPIIFSHSLERFGEKKS